MKLGGGWPGLTVLSLPGWQRHKTFAAFKAPRELQSPPRLRSHHRMELPFPSTGPIARWRISRHGQAQKRPSFCDTNDWFVGEFVGKSRWAMRGTGGSQPLVAAPRR